MMRVTNKQQSEIDAQRNDSHQTLRVTVPALEKQLYTAIPILDHGFIRVVDYMGDDSSIVQAARVSYGTGTKKVSDDTNLIRYLMRHHHTTPFEMCEIKFHVKLPIFVARQWIRHRTANVNEYSARYSILDREFYVPEHEVLAQQSKTNNQGREGQLDYSEMLDVQNLIRNHSNQSYDEYEHHMQEYNLARELARMNLTLNYYTQWYWKVDLHNLLNFLSLRADSHAQYEIRVYADMILDSIVEAWVPATYKAFCDYRLNAETLSQQAVKVVQSLVEGRRDEAEKLRADSGIKRREWDEFIDVIGLS